MSYAKRTCHKCGYRDIQPNMYETVVKIKTGSSKRGVNGATVAGVLSGSKRSGNAVKEWFFNTQERQYYRNRKVWMCLDCVETKESKLPNWLEQTLGFGVLIFFGLLAVEIFT